MPQKILVAASQNPQTAQAALTKAVALARRLNAPVEVFSCNAEYAFALKHEFELGAKKQSRDACMAEARRYVARLCSEVDCAGVELTTDVVCETPEYEAIARKALRSKATLVVRDMSGRPGSRGVALDETDWELARTCPAPLMLVRSRPWGRNPRVVAALDLSGQETPQLEERILSTAALLVGAAPHSIDVVYCDESARGSEDVSSEEALRALIERAGLRESEAHIVRGGAAVELPRFVASRECDVFVIGALAHRTTLTIPVGTLTGTLFEALPCDFVLVKPVAFSCPISVGSQQSSLSSRL